jgi:hypothetical protein
MAIASCIAGLKQEMKNCSTYFVAIPNLVTVIGTGELQRLAEALQPQAALLEKLMRRV